MATARVESGPTPHRVLRHVVEYAILAPSSHNTQPWLFRISGDHVDVLADRRRRLPVVDPAVLFALRHAAAREGAWFFVAHGVAQREGLARLIAQGDRLQMGEQAFRRELAEWVRSNHSPAGDGMPGAALGMGDLRAAAGPFVIRTFDIGPLEGYDPPVSVGATVAHLGDAALVCLSVTVGLSHTAADLAVALGWRVSLRRGNR